MKRKHDAIFFAVAIGYLAANLAAIEAILKALGMA